MIDTISSYENLSVEKYQLFLDSVKAYRTEPSLTGFKKLIRKKLDEDIDAGTGGSPCLLDVLNGDPFIVLRIPEKEDPVLNEREVETSRDMQMMTYDLLDALDMNYSLIYDISSYDYYIVLAFDEKECQDFGMTKKSLLGGSLVYDEEARIPVMYQLNLNPIEKVMAQHDKKLCQTRWEKFDKKYGFHRDEKDRARHQDGSIVRAEEMQKIMGWEKIGVDGRDWIEKWREDDKQYEQKYKHLYEER